MRKKIFISGGKGMLASAVEQFYVELGNDVVAPAHGELDILKTHDLEKALINSSPDIVFHTAALHVEDCENNPELAFKINSKATNNIARICQKINAVLVYISSCGYFGDEIKYYSENDPVVLKTIYARSKYEGEMGALKECQKTFAIRPGWLFGGSIKHKKNFFYQRYLEALKSKVIKSADDKFGCPTLVDDLIIKIYEMVNTSKPGVYHVTNDGGCSRADYVKKIVESCGLETKVIAVDSSNFIRKANVPNCELLENINIKKADLGPLPSWEDALEKYAKKIKNIL